MTRKDKGSRREVDRESRAPRLAALVPFYKESLVRNAVFLLAGNVVMSALGFAFWIVSTNLFSAHQVGIATVIISAAAFVTSTSLLGLDQGIVRFLSTSKDRDGQLDSSLTLVVAATVLVGSIYVALTPLLSTQLAFLRHSPVQAAVFILLTVALATNSMFQATFISFRSAGYVLLGNTTFSVTKVAILPVLVAAGSFGMVGANLLGMLLSVIVGFVLLRRRFAVRIRPRVSLRSLRVTRRYSMTLYGASIENALVQAVIPLAVLNQLGATQAAVYYIVFSIAAVLAMIASATGQSLLAEGAHSQDTLHANVRKAAIHIGVILLPTIAVLVLTAKYILLIFGKSYSVEGTELLQILALSSPFVALNYIADSIANIRHRNRLYFTMNTLNAGMILIFSVLLVGSGLRGLGWAWMLAQALTVVIYVVVYWRELPAFYRGAR